MSRNASAARRTRSSRTSRRLGALALAAAAAATLPLADAAVASAAPSAPSAISATASTGSAFSLSTHSVAFGSRNTGSATTKKVVLKNTGTKALHPVQVLSAPASVSSARTPAPRPRCRSVAAARYTVRFAPTAAGAVSASLQVLTTEGTPAQNVAISGTGVQQLMEHYYFQYTFTNPPVINGVAAPQSFIGTGYAAAGTYATGQTIDVFDVTGLRQIGTYRIGAVDNSVALDSALLNTVDVNEYDWGTNRYTAATGLIDQTGHGRAGQRGRRHRRARRGGHQRLLQRPPARGGGAPLLIHLDLPAARRADALDPRPGHRPRRAGERFTRLRQHTGPVVSSKPTQTARRHRILDGCYAAAFVLYVGGLLLWLAVGLLPPLIALVGPLREAASSVAAGQSGLAHTAGLILDERPTGSEKITWVIAYLFSALNLALGLLLAVRMPRQRESRLLSIAFIGTAATFNQPSHVVFHLLTSAPILTAVHFAFHVLSGVAYLWAVVLFPDGELPVAVPRRLAVPGGLLITAAVAWVCWRSSFIQHPPFFVAFFGVLVPIAGIAAQSTRIRALGAGGGPRTATDLESIQQSRLLRTALVPALLAAMLWLLLHGVELLVGEMAAGAGTAATRLETLFPALFAIVPLALFVAILRLHLWDLDRVLSRALLISLVAGAVCGLYVGVLALAAAVSGGIGWSVAVAVAVVAVVIEPVRRGCTRLANRVVFGQELPPREALRRLTDQLARGDGSDELAELTAVVVAGTRASAASVWVRMGGQLVRASCWPAQDGATAILLPGGGAPVDSDTIEHAVGSALPGGWCCRCSTTSLPLGALAVRTPPGVELVPAERRLISQLAGHAGMLVANALLTRSLMDQVDAVRAQPP